MSLRSMSKAVLQEAKRAIAPALFFAIGFNLLVFTTNLLLHDYHVKVSSFLLATGGALVVAKAVLIADALPFFHRFDTAPLIQPVLFKSIVYFLVVCLARIVEQLLEYLGHGGTLGAIPDYATKLFSWNRFVAIQLWVFVLFIIYTFISELNTLFGDGELSQVLFKRRSSSLKLTRRQRIRTLAKLGQLADAHTVSELRDPATAAHAEMIGLVHGLAYAP